MRKFQLVVIALLVTFVVAQAVGAATAVDPVKQLRAQVTALKKQLASARSQVVSAQSIATSFQNQTSALQGQVTSLTAQLAAAKADSQANAVQTVAAMSPTDLMHLVFPALAPHFTGDFSSSNYVGSSGYHSYDFTCYGCG